MLDGWGGPALLDSCEIERRPVQTRVIEAAVANMPVLASELLSDDLASAGPAGEDARRAAHARIQFTKDAEFHALDFVLDIAYASPEIAAGGARLRHAWLDDGRSLYDALGDEFSLLHRGDQDVSPIADAAQGGGQAVIALPPEHCDPVMFGPAGTFDPAVLDAAHATYAPAPAVELIAASRWAAETLPALAPNVRVPVHNVLAEHDALWDTSATSIARFAPLFSAAPSVDATVMPGVGHSIDHHTAGRALHRREFAFAHECALRPAPRLMTI